MASAYSITRPIAGPRAAAPCAKAVAAAPPPRPWSRLVAWWQARPIPDDDEFDARQY